MKTPPCSVAHKATAVFIKSAGLCVAALALCLSAEAAKVALKPQADVTIDQKMPDRNLGKSAWILSRASTAGTEPDMVQKGYLRFDASNLPKVVDIESLDVVFSGKRGRSGRYFMLTGPEANQWEEGTITWNNAPGNNPAENLDGFTGTSGLVVTEIGRHSGQPNILGQVELGTKDLSAEAAKKALIEALNSGERKVTIVFRHTGSRAYGISSKESNKQPATLNLVVAD